MEAVEERDQIVSVGGDLVRGCHFKMTAIGNAGFTRGNARAFDGWWMAVEAVKS